MGISSTSSAWEADNLGSVGDIAQMLAFGPLLSVRDSRIPGFERRESSELSTHEVELHLGIRLHTSGHARNECTQND
jgi:hypothetical protein